MNQTTIMGFAGRDAELKQTRTGKAVAKVSIGVTKKTGDMQKTTWFPVQAWNKTAEILGRVKKGDGVMVNGQMEENEWKDKDGNPKKNWQLTAWAVAIVPKTSNTQTSSDADVPDFDDNAHIPF